MGGVAKELPAATLYNTAWVKDGVKAADFVSAEGIVVPNSGEGRSSPLSSLLELEVVEDYVSCYFMLQYIFRIEE